MACLDRKTIFVVEGGMSSICRLFSLFLAVARYLVASDECFEILGCAEKKTDLSASLLFAVILADIFEFWWGG